MAHRQTVDLTQSEVRGRNGWFAGFRGEINLHDNPSIVEVAIWSRRTGEMPPVMMLMGLDDARNLAAALTEAIAGTKT